MMAWALYGSVSFSRQGFGLLVHGQGWPTLMVLQESEAVC